MGEQVLSLQKVGSSSPVSRLIFRFCRFCDFQSCNNIWFLIFQICILLVMVVRHVAYGLQLVLEIALPNIIVGANCVGVFVLRCCLAVYVVLSYMLCCVAFQSDI